MTKTDNPEDYTPLEKLLKSDTAKMSDEELATFMSDMRALRTSAPTKKAAIQGRAPAASKVLETINRFL